MRHMQDISHAVIKEVRAHFWRSLNRTQRRELVVNTLKGLRQDDVSYPAVCIASCKFSFCIFQENVIPLNLHVPGLSFPICHAAWRMVYGFSESSWTRYKRLSVQQQQVPITLPIATPKVQHITLWLNRFAESNGEPAPNANRIFLPSWMCKRDVYDLYKKECEGEGHLPVQTVPLTS